MCMCVFRTIRAVCNRAKDFCWGGGLQSGAKELSSRGVCAGFEKRPRPITARGTVTGYMLSVFFDQFAYLP